jgi:hypothetical protein
MLAFFGDCEKHEFVLAVALVLGAVSEQEIAIVSDNHRNYKYFNGEVSGIRILGPTDKIMGDQFVIYDCHKILIPDTPVQDVIMFTDSSRPSVDSLRTVYNSHVPAALVIVEQETRVSKAYIEDIMGKGVRVYSYYEDLGRKVDLVYNEKIKFKSFDKNFLGALGKFLIDQGLVANTDLKQLWAYLRKRG